jgi:hypothetical protein
MLRLDLGEGSQMAMKVPKGKMLGRSLGRKWSEQSSQVHHLARNASICYIYITSLSLSLSPYIYIIITYIYIHTHTHTRI